jgi:hypothetical protein
MKYGPFMQHSGAIAMRRAFVIENASHRRINRGSLFARIVDALHASRRIEANRVLRRYQYLITSESWEPAASAALHFNKTEESTVDANRDKTCLRANEGKSQRKLQGA